MAEYFLIGEKLGHSFSKEIHKLIANYDYELKELSPSALSDFLEKKNFRGLNVTIPYKQTVIPYLYYIEENAKKIGAVNTIVNRGGKLYGYNTDFIGLKNLILFMELDLNNKKVLILGTGGTSKTATAVAESLSAKEILFVSRNPNKSDKKIISYEQAKLYHNDAQFIINTTPNGMFPEIQTKPIDLENFSMLEGVVDVIYNPLKSSLVLQAEKKGIKAQGGLFMFVQQAISASEFFLSNGDDIKSLKKSTPKVSKIYNSVLQKKQNIVLIGMPGSGKTLIGRKLSEVLNRQFFDIDEIITKKVGKRPVEIIEQQGESAFREIECNVCKELANKNGVVISTGGGTILREENVTNLKHNGFLIFVDRTLDALKPTKNRPLTNSKEKLKSTFEQRYPLYKKICDMHIKSDDEIRHTISIILDKFDE